MARNILTTADFQLRLFIDTNILIDYADNFNGKKCVKFLNLFKKSKVRRKAKIEEIELITSDYVLWELKGHMREELYGRHLISNHGYGVIPANKECLHGKFKNAHMDMLGEEISKFEKKIFEDECLLYLERLMNKPYQGLSETIDLVLKESKFSYKDAIVFTSACFTQSNFIITCDEQDFNEKRLEELEVVLKALHRLLKKPIEIKFKRPADFLSTKALHKEYKDWFTNNHKQKAIGTVAKYYSKINVVEIQCSKNIKLKIGDQGWLIKFDNNNKMMKHGFTIKKDGLRSPKTKESVQKGGHVCVKLEGKRKKWDDALVFFAA